MSLKKFADALPDYAKDLRLNLSSILNDQTLGEERKAGLLLACAHGSGYKPLVDAAEAEVDRQAVGRDRQCRARRGRGDGDEQRLLPLRPPRREPGIWHHARQAAHEPHRHRTASTRKTSSCSALRCRR